MARPQSPGSEPCVTTSNWKLAMDTFGETDHLHRMILCRSDIDSMRHLPEPEWYITVAGLPVYWIFPNVILMPFTAGAFLVRAYPNADDPGRHTSRIDFYMKSQLRNARGTEGEEIAEIIRDEDYVMGESQQLAASAASLPRHLRREAGLNESSKTGSASAFGRASREPELTINGAGTARSSGRIAPMAILDVPGFVADLKDHAADHGFHVHDERHFIETYSMRQAWEVDLHPERACGGPLDLHLAIELDPRTLLMFEDAMLELPEEAEPPPGFEFPLIFTWVMPPLPKGPDLLRLATDLAGVGGVGLPLEVSAIDSTVSVTDAPERTLSIQAKLELSLGDLFMHRENLCEVFDRCYEVSEFLLDRAPIWLDDV